MKTISLVIPFYNTSRYFIDVVELSLNNDFVSEIIVNDDTSSEDEWEKLNDIINDLNSNKIKLFRNENNLGGFRNKYNAVNNSTCEWVYLLDSDNILPESSIEIVNKIKNLNPNTYYSPIQLNLKDDGLDPSLDQKKVIYNFPKKLIDINLAKKYLSESIVNNQTSKPDVFLDYNSGRVIEWFLNTGNFFVNRKTYLKTMKFIFDNISYKHIEADAVVFTAHWLMKGNKIEIVDNLCYTHRVRKQSYTHAVGSKNLESLQYHQKLLLES